MKNKRNIIIFIACLIFVIATGYFVIDYNKDYNLIVEPNLVDEKSPDRILKVYNGDKEIKFKQIEYTDGVYLCNYEVPAVNYTDIKNEKELVVVVKYGKKVKAKIKNSNN